MTDRKSKPAAKPKKATKTTAPKKKAPSPRARSETGKTKLGKSKKLNVADSVTESPVTPEKDPMPEHIARGLALGLSLKAVEFVEVYLTCYNGTRSYMEVYGTTNYNLSGVEASRMLRKSNVREYLASRVKEAFARTEAAQDQLIQTYEMLAYGDVNELIEYRREACRFCHGDGHLYHFTPQEMRDARENHKKMIADAVAGSKGEKLDPAALEAMAPFDELGGVGFDPRREPHPECPECHGEGRGRVHFHDTRNLSPAALALYEGAEITKDGIKIRTSSRDGAREKLAKILKVYDDAKSELTINLSSDALEAIYGDRMRKSRERAEAMRLERGLPSEG